MTSVCVPAARKRPCDHIVERACTGAGNRGGVTWWSVSVVRFEVRDASVHSPGLGLVLPRRGPAARIGHKLWATAIPAAEATPPARNAVARLRRKPEKS